MEPNLYNFFKFLEQKKGEQLPLSIRLFHEPDSLDDYDLHTAIQSLSRTERAKYFNKLLKKHIFDYVDAFNHANNTIALAYTKNDRLTFINMNGKESIEGLDVDKIRGKYSRATWFNVRLGEYKYEEVGPFKLFSRDNPYALAKDVTGKYSVIDEEGNEKTDIPEEFWNLVKNNESDFLN